MKTHAVATIIKYDMDGDFCDPIVLCKMKGSKTEHILAESVSRLQKELAQKESLTKMFTKEIIHK